jgi:hypothetical protein
LKRRNYLATLTSFNAPKDYMLLKMSRAMEKLIKYLTIKEEFVCEGEMNEMKERIQRIKDVTFEEVNTDEVRLYANAAVGIMSVSSGGFAVRIGVKILLDELEPGLMKVTIKSSMRYEHYIIALIFVIILFAIMFSNESKWFIPLILGLWPITQIWFRFVYRYQEYLLVDKVIAKLGMKRIKDF